MYIFVSIDKGADKISLVGLLVIPFSWHERPLAIVISDRLAMSDVIITTHL